MSKADKARKILALRTLMIACAHQPTDASVGRLFTEALEVGEQYEPRITEDDLRSLWPMLSELFGPLPRRFTRKSRGD